MRTWILECLFYLFMFVSFARPKQTKYEEDGNSVTVVKIIDFEI